MKRPATLPLLFSLIVSLAGCGGNGGVGVAERTISLSPSRSSLAPGETATILLTQTGYGEPAYTLSVLEGPAGGVLSETGVAGPVNGIARIYTAPSTPGTYHVTGTVSPSQGFGVGKTIEIVVAKPLG